MTDFCQFQQSTIQKMVAAHRDPLVDGISRGNDHQLRIKYICNSLDFCTPVAAQGRINLLIDASCTVFLDCFADAMHFLIRFAGIQVPAIRINHDDFAIGWRIFGKIQLHAGSHLSFGKLESGIIRTGKIICNRC